MKPLFHQRDRTPQPLTNLFFFSFSFCSSPVRGLQATTRWSASPPEPPTSTSSRSATPASLRTTTTSVRDAVCHRHLTLTRSHAHSLLTRVRSGGRVPERTRVDLCGVREWICVEYASGFVHLWERENNLVKAVFIHSPVCGQSKDTAMWALCTILCEYICTYLCMYTFT